MDVLLSVQTDLTPKQLRSGQAFWASGYEENEMGNHSFGIVLGFALGVSFTILVSLAKENSDYTIHIESYQMGQKHALKTNPVSWELEETCLRIWTGKEML
jgi:hypothetical protein